MHLAVSDARYGRGGLNTPEGRAGATSRDGRRGARNLAPAPPEPASEAYPDPSFHEFASEWFEATKGEWREKTRLDYEWQLAHHLLPFFRDHRLSQITAREIDRYRQGKVAEGQTITAAATRGKPLIEEYVDKHGRRRRRPDAPLRHEHQQDHHPMGADP